MNNNLLIIAGIFLIVEAIWSMVYSQDKRSISQVGRIIRIGIGIFLISSTVKK